MIDINEHARQALRIARDRERIGQASADTLSLLKHCAGEVVEATESYVSYIYQGTEKAKKLLAGELADIVECALIIAAAHDIDIEQALSDCQDKNERRTGGIV